MRRTFMQTLMVSFVALSPMAAFAEENDEASVVAVIKLKGALAEAPSQSPLAELLGEGAPPNMFDLLEQLRKARKDKNLRAVVFDIADARLGFGQIQELRAQIEGLRAADKDVLLFAETLGNGSLLFGSAASQLVLLPTGVVTFNGLYAEGAYFKNMLDKLGVQADIIHCGAYKSAGEPFYLTGPSKEAEEQTNRLIDSIFEQLLAQVGKSRGLDPTRVRELIDIGEFNAKEALEAKLVDKLQYREDFIASIKKKYGKDVKITHKYGKKKGPEVDFDNPFAIFKLFGDMMKGKKPSDKPAVGVVFVEGPITTGPSEEDMFGGSSNAGSDTIRKAIAQAAADKKVKALVLRVNSPGGSAIASEIICEATKRFRASGRPVVVSMGNVAGSGGYYVSTLGDVIFADPGTITGSIGVVGGKFVTKGFWDWIGVTGHEYKRGKRSDLMNSNRPFDPEERALYMKYMNQVYDEFKARVTEGRGKKIKGDLESLAGGRVYTGQQAIEIGLVDRLGSFADAIKHAVEEAQLGANYQLRVFPKPKSLMDVFSEAFGGEEKEDEFVRTPSLAKALRLRSADAPAIGPALEAVRRLDPQKAEALRVFLLNVDQLGSEGVLLIGPPIDVTLN